MYPARFEYSAATTLDEALSSLDRFGEEGKVLAGGQSLIPLMKLRFAAPGALVDINRVEGLDGLSDEERRAAHRRARAPQGVRALRAAGRPLRRAWGRRAADLRPARAQPGHGRRLAGARRPAGRLGLGPDGAPMPASWLRAPAGGARSRSRTSSRDRSPRRSSRTRCSPRSACRIRAPGPAAPISSSSAGSATSPRSAWPCTCRSTTARCGRAGIALTAVGPTQHARRARPRTRSRAPTLDDDAIDEAARLAAEAAEPRDDAADRPTTSATSCACSSSAGSARHERGRGDAHGHGRRRSRSGADACGRGRRSTASRARPTWSRGLLLVHFLRETLGLTGTHIGCDTTSCGACTVLLDGMPVKSCTMFAVQADGREITTVEGLEPATAGCTRSSRASTRSTASSAASARPGMMLTAIALLEENPDPSEEEIRWALSGNVCRCTGYQNIVKAVQRAAAATAEERRRAMATSSTRSAGIGHSVKRKEDERFIRGQGQLRRRRHAARHAPHGAAAQPVRARADPLDRHLRGGGAAGRGRRGHGRADGRSTGSPGCRRCPATPRPCSPPTRCASRARRSPAVVAEDPYTPRTRSS